MGTKHTILNPLFNNKRLACVKVCPAKVVYLEKLEYGFLAGSQLLHLPIDPYLRSTLTDSDVLNRVVMPVSTRFPMRANWYFQEAMRNVSALKECLHLL
jgi:hypothetical protein